MQSLSQVAAKVSNLSPPVHTLSESGSVNKPTLISSRVIPAQTNHKHGNKLPKYDRSTNVILFGLPESSLLETKSAIDDMFVHLIGKTVRMLDAFRLGRRKDTFNNLTARPRPILIKLDSCWDKRLILSACRKLKVILRISFLFVKTFLLMHGTLLD